jgi:CheY-like chemotaxis protein
VASLLIVDDDEGTLSWMAEALHGIGHEARTFVTGRDALDALASWRPDLIIADILMPEMDGLTFTRLARRLSGVPVVFISIARERAAAVLAGAVGFIQKPVTAAEVRAAVERVLLQGNRRNTILVVDDDADIRELYRSFLEPRFDVLEAADGQEALNVLSHHLVDLAIVDVRMPVMNGMELIRAMRSDPTLQTLPVIVQTSDQTALKAPVWRDLNVSQLVDKTAFLTWLSEQIEEHLRENSGGITAAPT